MIVQLPFLIPGILFLWLPRRWMRWGAAFMRRRRRVVEPWNAAESGDPRLGFRTEFTKFRNYVDLLRGAAGGFILTGGWEIAPAILAEPGAPRSVQLQAQGLRFAILVVGVIIQTIRIEKRRMSFYPPVFFVGGITLGLIDFRGALCAFALTWTINPVLPNARGFLLMHALLIGVFGHLFAGKSDLNAGMGALLAFLPVLTSLLAKRPLVVLARKARHITR